jgi:methylthioribulose-1-phosphate dehydratase
VTLPSRTEAQAVADLISAGRWMADQGFLPATSGNLSARLDGERVAVTVSGVDKGALEPDGVLFTRLADPPPAHASAETLLHLELYRRLPHAGAVLHGHSMAATLISQREEGDACLRLTGYELLKAFRGVRTHEAVIEVPVFENRQDIEALASEISKRLEAATGSAYLLAGHGFYVWGETMAEARRHAGALDFLLRCELEKERLR